MSELRTFGAVSLSFTACLGLVVVTACAIPLREREERAEAVVSTPVQTDPTAVRLRECRSVTPEQEDLLRWEFAKELPSDAQVRSRFAQKVGASGGSSNPAAISHEYHRRQLADFIAAIQEKRAPVVDGKEGRKAVEIILGIYEAARTGRTVELG